MTPAAGPDSTSGMRPLAGGTGRHQAARRVHDQELVRIVVAFLQVLHELARVALEDRLEVADEHRRAGALELAELRDDLGRGDDRMPRELLAQIIADSQLVRGI